MNNKHNIPLPKNLPIVLQDDYIALVKTIFNAFDGVTLGNGIGLWEGQGHDDRLSPIECTKLSSQDETQNWQKITVKDLYLCESSWSFFDAEGFRFHLPLGLLLNIGYFEKEEDQLHSEGSPSGYSPDMIWRLTSLLKYKGKTDKASIGMWKHCEAQFEALNTEQITCVIAFLKYQQQLIIQHYKTYAKDCHSDPGIYTSDENYNVLEKGSAYWEQRLNST